MKIESKLYSPLTSVIVVPQTSPSVNGYRQSILNFIESRTDANLTIPIKSFGQYSDRRQSSDTVFSDCTSDNLEQFSLDAVKSLTIDAFPSKQPELSKQRGRPKKQSTLTQNLDENSRSSQQQIKLQKLSKSTRSRKTTNLRRSVSTSNLPTSDQSVCDPSIQFRTHTAKSVSPKKPSISDRKYPKSSTSYQQTQITCFGVRRTARQFAKFMQEQREADVISAIINGEESGMKVIMTDEKGRGVISTHTFSAGEFVVEYVGELISDSKARIRETEYKKNPDLGSFMFFFAYGGQRYCVDATKETDHIGRLINHSRLNPNCFVKIVPIDGIPRLTLFAKNEILPGEELLYDYGDRDKESLLSHPWLKF